ncbi:MAG: penicillin acylase family protein [FCB group bacterium]|nr:penicillin acylase family protein [FCB group bacterium]MBL7028889.1 penicillin acylase family protein [Candidatus Neomarinimicrobiota bacterium]MBL7122727.1 penicillin acylase family protein [Candidatus Neomarinimicrobiota bacterium]
MTKKIVVGVILMIVLGAVFLNHYLKIGIPDHAGEVMVKGLDKEVSILRDASGIPHIMAETEADAFFALGYAMSQDRLFQMEFLRAAGNGSLSEILGESMLKSDKFLRRIMLRPRNSEELFNTFPPGIQTMLTSFRDGINAFIKDDPDLPIEFRLLGHAPMLWSIADMMAIVKLQSWQLSYNYDMELIYRQLNEKLGVERAAELFPYYSPDHLKLLDTFGKTRSGDSELISQATELRELLGSNGGSNNWVVSGERSVSGKPLLASDPHLHGSRLPGPWYFAHLSAPGLDVAGSFFPGLPTALIGHNRNIAWGITNMGPDVQDLFIEETNPDDATQYMYEREWLEFEIIPQTIRIKDSEEEDGFRIEEFEIRKTIHGPIVKEDEEILALSWTGHQFDGEMEAFYRLNHAQDWVEFSLALSHFSTAPQNFVYADIDGNIGYYGAGKVPIRKSGSGIFPVPGWSGEFDWEGYIPFEDMPHIYNPEGGMIVSANAEPYSANYPYPMPGVYAPEYRTRRIKDLIESKEKLSLDDMAAFQFDRKSYLAPVFLKHLIPVIPESHQEIRNLLEAWDHELDPNGVEGSIYHESMETFLRLIWVDDMGLELAEKYLDTWYISLNRWVKMLEDNQNPWYDIVETAAVETRDDLLLEAFETAMTSLEQKFESEDFKTWEWGIIHNIAFHHPFEAKGGLIEKFFNYGPFPFGGDGETVNRGTHNFDAPYMAEMTASMRLLVDLSDVTRSRMANASGQVGMPLHKHYTDLVDIWLAGEYVDMHLDKSEFGEVQKLSLIPKE